MAIAEVQVKSGKSTSATAPTATLDAPSTNHNLLVAVLSGYALGVALGPITPPAGWLEAITCIDSGGDEPMDYGVSIWYYQNAPVTAGAISFLWGNSERTVMHLGEYSDMNQTGVLDKIASFTDVASSVLVTGTTATTAQGAELLIGALGIKANVTLGTFTNSFTEAQTDIASSGSFYNRLTHLKRIVSSTGAYGSGATPSATGTTFCGAIATFKGNVATGTMTMDTDRANLTCRGMKLSSTYTQDGVILRPLASGLYRG